MVYLRRLVLTAILMAVLGTTVQADDVRVGGLMANVPSLFSRTKTEELEKIYEDKSSGRKVEFLGFDAEGSKSATDPAFIKLIIDFLKIRLGGQSHVLETQPITGFGAPMIGVFIHRSEGDQRVAVRAYAIVVSGQGNMIILSQPNVSDPRKDAILDTVARTIQVAAPGH